MRVPEEDKRDQAVSPAAGMTLLCKFPHCYPLKPAMLSDEIRRRLGRRYYFVCTAWSCLTALLYEYKGNYQAKSLRKIKKAYKSKA